MWSPSPRSYTPKNRVSPAQNGVNKSHGGDTQSTSGVHIEVQPNVRSSDLTKLIRKRKYDKIDSSQAGHLFSVSDGTDRQWTPPLSVRVKNKHAAGSKMAEEKSMEKKSKFQEIGYTFDVWRSTFNKIEGYQGTGVLSYFVFLKWMVWLNTFLSIIVVAFIVVPYAVKSPGTYTTGVTGTNIQGVDTSNTAVCSLWYQNNVTYKEDIASVVQDSIQGTGWMEQRYLFYGFYDAVELDFGRSGDTDLNYLFPFAYFMTTLGVFFFSLVHMTGFVVSSIQENADENYTSSGSEYCGKVLGGWEYTLNTDKAYNTKCRSIHRDLLANLNHQKHLLTTSALTTGQKCRLFTVRFLVNLIIIGMLGGAGYGIYVVNELSTEYLAEEKSSSGSVLLLVFQFLPSLTITFTNIILPLIFKLLVILENYSDETVINITLARTVFLRLASLVMVMISLYNGINCTPKESTCNTNDPDKCIQIRCWETFVGQAFYKLMVTDFFVKVIVTFFVELPRKLITTKCSCSICAKIGPAEFDVAKCVLDLMYTQALCWMGFFYCPLLPAMTTIGLFLTMLLKLFSAFVTTKPSEKPYKASKSNHFFVLVLFVTFLVCCVPVTYAILKIRPSKGCGPFRIYTSMGTCVDTTIDSNWFASAAIVVGVFLITFLSLLIVFCCVRASALKKKARHLENQLLKESREKQILLDRVHSPRKQNNNRKIINNNNNTTTKSKPMPAQDGLNTLWM